MTLTTTTPSTAAAGENPAQVTATRIDPLDVAETQIAALAEAIPATADDILLLRGRLADYKRHATALLKDVDERLMIPFIKKNGPLVVNDIRYYVGKPKKEKCHNFAGAVDAILQNCGGDLNTAGDFFASDPIKPGFFKNTLGDKAFADFFTVTFGEKLEEGKPGKEDKLIEFNTKFVK